MPTSTAMSASPPHRLRLPRAGSCFVCGASSRVQKCTGCKVIYYCGKIHQSSHWHKHKLACKGVKYTKTRLDREEDALKTHQGDWTMPANPFATAIGDFWNILDTRDYMLARYDLVHALLKVETHESVTAALDHTVDILRLNHSDNMGIRDLAPGLMLRLGKDQECYSFIKWWTIYKDEESGGNSDDGTPPFLNLGDADILEDVTPSFDYHSDLSHQVALTLIKYRLYEDVKSLQMINWITRFKMLPQEISDLIRERLVREVTIKHASIRANITNRHWLDELKSKLHDQILKMFLAIHVNNGLFWPALVHSGHQVTVNSEHYSPGEESEAQIVLESNYESWAETDGAVERARWLLEGLKTNP